MNNVVMLMSSVFHVNNLTPGIINSKYKISMLAHCIYSTNKPFNLTLFQKPLYKQGKPILLCQHYFNFLTKIFFCFIVFIGCFTFNFGLFSLGSIWFLSVLVIFSWSCCSFLLQNELIMILNFSPRPFVRSTYLRTVALSPEHIHRKNTKTFILLKHTQFKVI